MSSAGTRPALRSDSQLPEPPRTSQTPNSSVQKISRWVQYTYFLRFTLISIVALTGIPYLAMRVAPTMFGGMLVLQEPLEILATAFLSLQVVWAIMISTRLTLLYGPDRFGVPAPIKIKENMPVWHLAAWALLALPLIVSVYSRSVTSETGKIAGVLFGVLFSVVLLYLAALVQHLVLSPDTHVPDLLFPKTAGLEKATTVNLRLGIWQKFTSECIRRIPRDLGAGYFDYSTNRLHSGHALAVAFLIVQTVIYFAGYLLLNPADSSFSGLVPALAYVLVLLILLSMASSAVAFLVDPYRFSVLLFTTLFVVFVYWFFDSDHYYSIQARQITAVSPSETVDSWKKRSPHGDVLTVIAANGGGIQAAAWTTTVVAGLQEACGPTFGRSIALISGVSGGSLGTILIANEFTGRGLTNDHNALAEMVDRSEKSTLNETAWGLVYPDTLRTLAPFLVVPKTKDRGWATEQAWRRDWSGANASMEDWTEEVKAGSKPAIVLNATLAESGEKLLLSNFSIPNSWGNKSFEGLYPNFDLSVVTAARLSATFPYVTPMAQPMRQKGSSIAGFHVGDGGYYDNYGVGSSIAYLRNVLPYYRSAYNGKKVMVLQIRSSPNGQQATPHGRWQWLQQVLGPITTLLSVRTSVQVYRNDAELQLLQETWEQQGGKLFSPVFQFTDPNPPLSWHLTPSQKSDLATNWQTYQKDQIQNVKEFLGCR